MAQPVADSPAVEGLAFRQAAIVVSALFIAVELLGLVGSSDQSRGVGFDSLLVVNVHQDGAVGEELLGVASCFDYEVGNGGVGVSLGLETFLVQLLFFLR